MLVQMLMHYSYVNVYNHGTMYLQDVILKHDMSIKNKSLIYASIDEM